MNNAIGAITALLIASTTNNENVVAKKIKEMTEQHRARVVWCQQARGEMADIDALGQNLRIVGFDTDDGVGERVICGEHRNYHKPLFSSDGEKIIFSDIAAFKIYTVNWDGTDLRYLTDGTATEVWRDPNTGIEWVYFSTNISGPNYGGKPVYRCRLNDPVKRETVWTQTEVSPDNFQLSADGRYAAASFGWPSTGVADLFQQSLSINSRGCWPSMAPDLSYRYWIFRNQHTYVEMYQVGRPSVKTISFTTNPELAGAEVYHPRWSNNTRLFVLTGPYVGGVTDSRVANAGRDVEIYIGQFNADYSAVSCWQRVSFNGYGDFFPDLWVAE